MRKLLYAGVVSIAGLAPAHADTVVDRYEQCQTSVHDTNMVWPELIQGRRFTFAEALGEPMLRRACDCVARRLHSSPADWANRDFPMVTLRCMQDLLGK